MKNILFIIFLLPNLIFAQGKGIQFVEGLNWQQVKAKAKIENKFIMIDCYTSWCGPCKVMDASVFPNDTIGQIANEKFVALKVQFDEDENAGKLKKEWFQLSKKFEKQFNVTGYPCILFFNPDGEIVHKIIGLRRVPGFKKTLETVTDPSFQYYSTLEKYNKDPDNSELLYQLIQVSKDADELRKEYIQNYLAKTGGINSERNAQLLIDMTHSSKDQTFPSLTKDSLKINHFLGEGKAEEQYRGIIYFEEFQNTLGRNSAMGYYINDPNPDWKNIQDSLVKKYPERIEEIMDYAKLNFYRIAHQWDKYLPTLTIYREKYKNSISDKMKLEYIGAIAVESKDVDQHYLKSLLDWGEDALKVSNNPMDQMNYSVLLYQTGKNGEALEVMKQNIDHVPDLKYSVYPEYLQKMQLGEKL